MDRRLVGALVLVVAVVAALAGNGRTKQLAGDPVAGPVPGPPAVGQCVLAPVVVAYRSEGANRGGAGSDISKTMDGEVHPFIETGRCGSSTWGEVIGVLPDGLDYEPPADGRIGDDPESPRNRCYGFLTTFLGESAAAEDATAAPGRANWYPAPMISVAITGPSGLQQRAGQRWLACVSQGLRSASGEPAPYRGSLRDARASSTYPPELARCLSAAPDQDEPTWVDCTDLHTIELLANAWTDAPTEGDAARLSRQCSELASALTGMPDPTAGGRLAVVTGERTLPVYGSNGALDPDHMIDVQYYCYLQPVDDRGVLTGPLLGLGDGRLPLR